MIAAQVESLSNSTSEQFNNQNSTAQPIPTRRVSEGHRATRYARCPSLTRRVMIDARNSTHLRTCRKMETLTKSTMNDHIERFLNGSPFAVAGASKNRDKYGNKVLRCYQQNQMEVFPLNPTADAIEGLEAFSSLADCPVKPHGVSIITPPAVTEQIVNQAIELGIENIWMQPGAESPEAVSTAESAGINVIAGGPCILVVLGYHEGDSNES